jgi:hypothetical protein
VTSEYVTRVARRSAPQLSPCRTASPSNWIGTELDPAGSVRPADGGNRLPLLWDYRVFSVGTVHGTSQELRGTMQESSFEHPRVGLDDTQQRTTRSQQFERSLAECQAQVRALHIKLDDCLPAGSADPQWRVSGSDRPPLRIQSDSADPPTVDITVMAIGKAARRLLRDLERPSNGHRATDRSGRSRTVGT